jgi:hypothetical protein
MEIWTGKRKWIVAQMLRSFFGSCSATPWDSEKYLDKGAAVQGVPKRKSDLLMMIVRAAQEGGMDGNNRCKEERVSGA